MRESAYIDILPDGKVQWVGSGNELTGSLATIAPLPRRVSSIEPVNPFLRLLFHGLRRIGGDGGRIAAFTRSWGVLWRVRIHGGVILPETFRDREEAITAELRHLEGLKR